jgi:hypothetical protein
VRQGLEAALQGSGLSQQWQQQQQTQQQQQAYTSPASPGAAGTFYSPLSSPIGSPQQPSQHVPYRVQTFTAYGSTSNNSIHPVIGSVLAVLNSPQLLQAVDGLVSTCVGSTVGAYMAQAGSSDNMLSSVLHTLSQPANKHLVIDIMSQVSATFCREMAAACVAPAAAVASRPSSRLSDAPQYSMEQQELLMQRQLSPSPIRMAAAPPAVTGSSSSSPFKPLGPHHQPDAAAAAAGMHHSISEGTFSHASDAAGSPGSSGSEPSSPQSGPSTPEPSVAAADAAGSSAQPAQTVYGSFAGSAVAGLILRRQSFTGLLSGAAAAAAGQGGQGMLQPAAAANGSQSGLVDPAALGPMSTAVSLFVQAARFQEFRSLMIDVSRSSTRVFVQQALQSLLPSGWGQAVRGSGRGGSSSSSSSSAAASAAVTVALQKVYTAVSVVILLMVYAMSPKMLMLEGGN